MSKEQNGLDHEDLRIFDTVVNNFKNQPKPMSVEEACDELDLQGRAGDPKIRRKARQDLIAAVRADERAKCAHEKTEALVSLQQCNNRPAEFVRGQERARVLAEFRMLAEKFNAIKASDAKDDEELSYWAGKEVLLRDLSRLIQSLETPNKKP